MKHLLNTLFFGYLTLKWRRLIRTIFTTPYLIWIAWCIISGQLRFNLVLLFSAFLLALVPIVSIALISWVVKPFVVK